MDLERCGHCYNWMKSTSCPREKKGLKPSIKSIACDDNFQKEKWVEELEKQKNNTQY